MTLEQLPDTWQWEEADAISQAIAKRHGLTMEELTSRKRTERFAWARFLAFYIISECSQGSLSSIARYFHRDHCAVTYGISAVKERMEASENYRAKVNAWVEFFKGKDKPD